MDDVYVFEIEEVAYLIVFTRIGRITLATVHWSTDGHGMDHHTTGTTAGSAILNPADKDDKDTGQRLALRRALGVGDLGNVSDDQAIGVRFTFPFEKSHARAVYSAFRLFQKATSVPIKKKTETPATTPEPETITGGGDPK